MRAPMNTIVNWSLKSFLFTAALFLFFGFAQSVHAFGVSPAFHHIDDMISGSEVLKEFTYVRSTGSLDKDQTIELFVEGPIADAVTLSEVVTVEKGVSSVKVPVIISAGDLPPGDYEVNILALASVVSDAITSGAGMQIQEGANAQIYFSITGDEVLDYTIDQTIIESTEEGQPVGFTFALTNKGNVAARPDEIRVVLTDQTDESLVIEETIPSQSIEFTDPFDRGEITVLLDTELSAGRYWVEFGFYKGEERIYHREDAFLQVFPPGTLAQEGELENFSIDKEQYAQGELGVFEGTFTNTGTVGVNAVFMIDVQKDGQRLEILKSEPIFVLPSKTASLSLEYRFSEEGNYQADGSVIFGISGTNQETVEFKVGGVNPWVMAGVLIFLLLLIVIVIKLVLRRKRRVVPPAALQQTVAAPQQVVVQNQPVSTPSPDAPKAPTQKDQP